ncbi:MAG: hypothetical protein ABI895_04065 [Deltaproteobacteria bacterium]
MRAGALFLAALCSCALDFDVSGRQFECPPEVTHCLTCNPDGSCRLTQELPSIQGPPEGPPLPPASDSPDASVAPEMPIPPHLPPVVESPSSDGGPSEPPEPDGGPPEPPSEVCPEFQARASDTLCLNAGQQCFTLGSVLSSALAVWLDPTTLPQNGSRHWCDRSGQRHHMLLLPDAQQVAVEPDGRAVSEALARSFQLDGAWLTMSEGTQPALGTGNFAILIAAAAPIEAADRHGFELFESGVQSRINLSIVPSTGKAVALITTDQTGLADTPVVTRSSVYDGGFHLYSLYRRSAAGAIDDVLQLRLNTVLEFRGSSIAFPRVLDLSSTAPPLIGSKTTSGGMSATGRGRVAAVVVLRGSVPEEELLRLENFLCTELAVCAAPAPPPGPAPVTDAGR